MSDDDLPQIAGRIGPAYGIKGWVHIRSFLEPPELLFGLESLWLQTKSAWEPMSVVAARSHGKGFVAGHGPEGYRSNVRTFIKRIRQKFRDIDDDFDAIENYPGYGYRWQADADGG